MAKQQINVLHLNGERHLIGAFNGKTLCGLNYRGLTPKPEMGQEYTTPTQTTCPDCRKAAR